MLLAACAALAGCVAYEAEDISLPAEAAALPSHVGTLSFADAVALAFANNGELKALEAELRAAGADVAPTELQGQLQDERIAVLIDPLALLGLAQRGAGSRLAETRAAEAASALAEARWRVVATIAEVFAHHAALHALRVPRVEVDAGAFVAAGLASTVARDQVRGAQAAATAEQHAIDAERSAQLAELRRLLGVARTVRLQIVEPPADWPPLPEPSDAAILCRPDLALALARYRTADAAFRKAVADQYPSLMLGPDVPLRGGAVDPMALLRLPIGASGPAEAARERRGAARHRIRDALAMATNEADASTAAHEAAEFREKATRASALASANALTAALAGLQVEVDAFERLSDRAPMAVRDAMEEREAAVAAARARVRRAVACGWPAAEVQQ